MTRPWGAVDALRTSEFSFGTGKFFDEEIYSCPEGEDLPDLLSEIKRTEAMFRAATRYARGAAIGIAAGFEAPRLDPTDPQVRARFQARVRQFLRRNPDISHFALWQHESGGSVGSEPPAAGSEAMALLESQRALFAHLGNEQRVWEAIRYGAFAQLAHAVLAEEAPGKPMVMVGWGGDRWMKFADYCLGYDKLFPENVIFTCHDNIDASMGPNVSTPWGQLPPERERWAMPWVEGDIAACAVRQPHVEDLGLLVPDALHKGCQGLLTLQWRTRDVEEETGFIARYAWNTALTPETFLRDLAGHAFGPELQDAWGERLAALQALGEHWTGVRGTAECSSMRWAGWEPHFPFEVGADNADFLIPMVEKTIQALATVPEKRDSEAAFHLLPREEQEAAARLDETRPGVAELRQVVKRLQALRGVADVPRLRTALREIDETVYALRPRLVEFGMQGAAYISLDAFLIAIHHLWRNAGAAEHMQALRIMREEVAGLRAEYLAAGRIARLERLDYLAATMDSALYFDAAVLLLADGEDVEQALARAEALREADPAGAAAVAAQAYAQLLDAGMQQAVLAFAAKLTTRCDFGTLATINVKPMPRYWKTLGELESYFPAIPPREVCARGLMSEVWLSWVPDERAAGQHLYRRPAGDENWTRVNTQALPPAGRLYIDRPAPGDYEYAVTAIDAAGWESPRSHSARATCGPLPAGPQLVACKPFTHGQVGEPYPLRVVARSDREITGVTIHYRAAGETCWQQAPMAHRFRCSYTGAIPGEAMISGTLLFYLEASDADGNISHWPPTAASLPWSVTVAE